MRFLLLMLGGYIGSSTKSEIEYAKTNGKKDIWKDN